MRTLKYSIELIPHLPLTIIHTPHNQTIISISIRSKALINRLFNLFVSTSAKLNLSHLRPNSNPNSAKINFQSFYRDNSRRVCLIRRYFVSLFVHFSSLSLSLPPPLFPPLLSITIDRTAGCSLVNNGQ